MLEEEESEGWRREGREGGGEREKDDGAPGATQPTRGLTIGPITPNPLMVQGIIFSGKGYITGNGFKGQSKLDKVTFGVCLQGKSHGKH